jgi:hypothetical protein
MAGLDDLDPSSPAGNALLSGGAAEIRLVITKLIEAYTAEHAGAGPHTIPAGPIAARPSPSYGGRFYILTVAGVAAELQYDTGSAWVTLTTNQSMINYADNLSNHLSASVIDHPDESVTSAKIKAGDIVKKHLMGGVNTDSLALLVNGGDANPLHTHTWDSQAGVTGYTLYNIAGPTTLIVPLGVVRMWFSLLGGGGAGGSGESIRGGGGGASGTIIWNYPMIVTPEQEIVINVGYGGLGNNISASAGGTGESTTVAGLPIAALGGIGGAGGYVGATGGPPRQGFITSYGGGSGGYDPFTGTKISATHGGSSAWFAGGGIGALIYSSGGGGGGSIFGPGKSGGTKGASGGSAADSSGGGGGGGGGGGLATWGGNGGSGIIMVSW